MRCVKEKIISLTAPPMDAEWALFAQMRAEIADRSAGQEKDNPTEAEARYLAFEYVRATTGPAGRTLTWNEYVDVHPTIFRPEYEHRCSSDHCNYQHCKWSQPFRDPRNMAKTYVATGIVYVCQATGEVHTCDSDCTEQRIGTHDAGTVICPISGRFKCALINNHVDFYVSNHQLMTEVPEKRGRKRSSSAAKSAAKRRAAGDLPDLGQPKEATVICRRLICSGVLRRALIDRMKESDKALEAEVRVRVRRGEQMDALQLSMITFTYVSPFFASAARLAAWGDRQIPEDVCAYIERCLMWMFYLARESPGVKEGGNDVNLRKMCFAMAYILRYGLVGYAEFQLETRTVVAWGLMNADDAWEPSAKEGFGWRRYVFVPAHPGLRNILPDKTSLPKIAEFDDDMAKLLKRTRRMEGLFRSVLRDSNTDVARFCLSTHIAMRPDILCD